MPNAKNHKEQSTVRYEPRNNTPSDNQVGTRRISHSKIGAVSDNSKRLRMNQRGTSMGGSKLSP